MVSPAPAGVGTPGSAAPHTGHGSHTLVGVPNLFTAPNRLPLVAPSILAADFADLADDARDALDAGGDLLHLDVMDGHFVPNLTIGPPLCRSLRRALPDAFLDVHLMVENPEMFFEPFARAGADHLTFHVEAAGERTPDLCARIRDLGLTAGVSLNPPTPAGALLPYVEHADLVLVMSVNPGFGGQSFIPEVLDKTRTFDARLRPDQRLEMDGGVGSDTAAACREAGCDVLVAGSAVFGHPRGDRSGEIVAIRGSG